MTLFRRVTVISQDGTSKQIVSVKKDRKKRVSRPLRPLERMLHHQLNAGDVFSSTLLSRHLRSRRKRREGWLRDGPHNIMKASTKAWKKLRKW